MFTIIKHFISISVWLMFSVTVSGASELEPVRGVVKSVNEAVLSVDISARITNIPVRTGESFKKNDVLLKFDCAELNAQKNAAKAAYNVADITHNNNLELQKYGAIGDIEVGLSEAKLKEARANSQVITARSKDCVLTAPFNGRVSELVVNNYEIAGSNQPLLKIIGSDDLELRLIVPSNWLSWLEVGAPFEFLVDETNNSHKAVVTHIGAEVDAVSRTVLVKSAFSDKPGNVLPGMSGSAKFYGNTAISMSENE